MFAYLEDYLPGLDKGVSQSLRILLRQRSAVQHHRLGSVSRPALEWEPGFVVLEQAMNIALRVPERRNFFESRLLTFGMIVLAGGSLALSLAITSALTTIQKYTLPVLGWQPRQDPFLWAIVGAVVPVLLAVLSFTVIYRVVPNTRVRWRSAAIAGLAAGLLWEAAKRGFTYYLLTPGAAYGRIYGQIGGIISLVFWIYYSAVILVLGAELASVLQDIHPHRGREGRRRRHQAAER